MHPALIAIPLCLVFMVLSTWWIHNKYVSMVGGWGRLGARFPASRASGARPARTWSGCSGWLGEWACYKHLLELGAGPEGLHLAVGTSWYSFGHPKLLIPWDQLEIGPDASDFYGTFTPVKFPSVGGTTLKLYSTEGDELRQARASHMA